MYTEVTRIRKPDPHVHEGDPNPVHTEVAKMAVFGSDICADLSGSSRIACSLFERGSTPSSFPLTAILPPPLSRPTLPTSLKGWLSHAVTSQATDFVRSPAIVNVADINQLVNVVLYDGRTPARFNMGTMACLVVPLCRSSVITG